MRTVQNTLRGKHHPKKDTVRAYAEALGVSAETLTIVSGTAFRTRGDQPVVKSHVQDAELSDSDVNIVDDKEVHVGQPTMSIQCCESTYSAEGQIAHEGASIGHVLIVKECYTENDVDFVLSEPVNKFETLVSIV